MAVSVIVKVGVKLLSTKKGRRFIVGIICAVFMLLFGITAAVWFIIASQNVEDLTLPGIKEYTKPLLSIPTHQFFFYPGIVSVSYTHLALMI